MAILESAPSGSAPSRRAGANQGEPYYGVVSVILASASPRRADLLRAAAIPFDIQPAEIDETRRGGEPPEAYVRRVAEAKVAAVGGRFPARIVLAADTAVVIGTDVLGKPMDGADAARMLGLLSGRVHEVMTAVCLLTPAGGESDRRLRTEVAATRVTFARLSEAEIAWYVASGEPFDKAGAYAIQGLASRFVTRIEGSYSNIVGLPIDGSTRCARRRECWYPEELRLEKSLSMSHKAAKIGATSFVLLVAFGVLLYSTLGESMQVLQVRGRGDGRTPCLAGQTAAGPRLRGEGLDRPQARRARLPVRHPAQRQRPSGPTTPASCPTRSRTTPRWC